MLQILLGLGFGFLRRPEDVSSDDSELEEDEGKHGFFGLGDLDGFVFFLVAELFSSDEAVLGVGEL